MKDEGEKTEKFDFTPEGETLGYISMDQARVIAVKHARDNADFYGTTYSGVNLVWEVVNQEETEDFYEIRIEFRKSGRRRGEPGVEHMTINKIDGEVEIRQVLNEPSDLAESAVEPRDNAEDTQIEEKDIARPKSGWLSRIIRRREPTSKPSTRSSQVPQMELRDPPAEIRTVTGDPSSHDNRVPEEALQSGSAAPGVEVQEFLRRFEIDYLRKRGILLTTRNLMQGKSVYPLVELMKEQNVERLISADGKWFLISNGEFANSRSAERRKYGHVDQLEEKGNVFKGQNKRINPHYEEF